jgi:hypothetical protein
MLSTEYEPVIPAIKRLLNLKPARPLGSSLIIIIIIIIVIIIVVVVHVFIRGLLPALSVIRPAWRAVLLWLMKRMWKQEVMV